jgi:hypothetical protein
LARREAPRANRRILQRMPRAQRGWGGGRVWERRRRLSTAGWRRHGKGPRRHHGEGRPLRPAAGGGAACGWRPVGTSRRRLEWPCLRSDRPGWLSSCSSQYHVTAAPLLCNCDVACLNCILPALPSRARVARQDAVHGHVGGAVFKEHIGADELIAQLFVKLLLILLGVDLDDVETPLGESPVGSLAEDSTYSYGWPRKSVLHVTTSRICWNGQMRKMYLVHGNRQARPCAQAWQSARHRFHAQEKLGTLPAVFSSRNQGPKSGLSPAPDRCRQIRWQHRILARLRRRIAGLKKRDLSHPLMLLGARRHPLLP